MKGMYGAVLVAVALSALSACSITTASGQPNLPIETPKAKYDGPKVSNKSVTILDVADAREDKNTFFNGDDRYPTDANLRLVVMESFAATLREAGFQTVPKDGHADLELTLKLTVARAEAGTTKPGFGVVAMRVTARTAGGTYERTIVGRDMSNPFMGGRDSRLQGAIQDSIAVASAEATKACVEVVKLEGGGT